MWIVKSIVNVSLNTSKAVLSYFSTNYYLNFKDTQIYPHVALILVQISFSGWHIFAKIALRDGADPIVFSLYREIIVSTCMYLYAKCYLQLSIRVSRQDILTFLIIGACSFVNVVGTIFALSNIPATKYALAQPTIPCIATILSVLLGIENLMLMKAFGIILAVFGALFVELWSVDEEGYAVQKISPIAGTLLVTIQCVSMASIIVLQKPLLYKYDPAVVTFVYYAIGAAITAVISIIWISRVNSSALIFHHHVSPWIALAYFPTLFAYNMYAWAGKQLPPSISTVYCTLQPVGTCLLSYFVLGQALTWAEINGGIIVIVGLLFTVYSRSSDDRDVISFRGDDHLSASEYNVNSYSLVSRQRSSDESDEVGLNSEASRVVRSNSLLPIQTPDNIADVFNLSSLSPAKLNIT